MSLENNGFAILKNVIDEQTVSALIKDLSKIKPSEEINRKTRDVYGVRNLLNLSPKVRKLAESKIVREIAEKYLGEKAKVVRAIYFDKTPDANWKVPWHQDLTISVCERLETKGFTAWTKKVGIHHVQPPIEILEKMLTLRFHLDDADETNGALKVIPQTHLTGRLSANEIQKLRRANETAVCCIKRGDVLLMRPLLLHSSSAGMNPNHRRVVHLEFSAEILPNGLNWYGS